MNRETPSQALSPAGTAGVLPAARAGGEFIVETLTDEVLVYDQVSHQAHCLSPAAALVWRLCDGESSYATAQSALRAAGHSEDALNVVSQLSAIGLIRAAAAPARHRPSTKVDKSRRQLLVRAAVAGVVVASPVVFSIVAPSVAEAASLCGAKTQSCCTGNKCNSGLKCSSGKCQ